MKPSRLSPNDEASLRAALAHATPPGGFTASLSCLAGILGEIDHLRSEVARLSGPMPEPIVAPYGERPDGSPKTLEDCNPWD